MLLVFIFTFKAAAMGKVRKMIYKEERIVVVV